MNPLKRDGATDTFSMQPFKKQKIEDKADADKVEISTNININRLANELLDMIFDFLPLADHLKARLTCRQWQEIDNTCPFWKRLISKQFSWRYDCPSDKFPLEKCIGFSFEEYLCKRKIEQQLVSNRNSHDYEHQNIVCKLDFNNLGLNRYNLTPFAIAFSSHGQKLAFSDNSRPFSSLAIRASSLSLSMSRSNSLK